MTKITSLSTYDLRFPTSASLDGSDAMNPDPDYSAAYVILETDSGIAGHGLTFTIGRGNDIVCKAIEALTARVTELDLDWIEENPGRFWRHMTGDSQLRWIGPDKGAMHLATGAVVNAVWDLLGQATPASRSGSYVADMTPEQLVSIVDFRYLTDAITPDEALAIFREAEAGKAARIGELEANGYPCYTTSAGWLGYSNEKLTRLANEAVEAGFSHIKMKVGRDLSDDIRRLEIVRSIMGPDRYLMIDANQVWEVGQAIDWVNELKRFNPYFIEEPTSPDDVEGHRKIREAIAPVKVATGEMCQNRILFKQFITRRRHRHRADRRLPHRRAERGAEQCC
jgi:L-fuconate dehydratase